VRCPVCATNPRTIARNTGNVGVVKHPAKASNNLRNEIGSMTGGSIGGSLSATTVVKGPSMLPSSHPKIAQLQVSPACHTHRRPTTKKLRNSMVNAAHLKHVPGRKTDVIDAQWIAEVLSYGLLRPSFVPTPCDASLSLRM
jgi:hypothetical protein